MMRRLALALLGAVLAWPAVAATGTTGRETFFVRPSADCPIGGDGLGFECATTPGQAGRAWSGFDDVVWNATTGVDDKDSLLACGSFKAVDVDISTFMLFVNASATGADEAGRFVISGDCSAYMTNPATWVDRSGVTRTGASLDGEGVLTHGVSMGFNHYLTIERIYFKGFTTAAITTTCSPTSDPLGLRIDNVGGENLGKFASVTGIAYSINGVTLNHADSDGIFVCNGNTNAAYGEIRNTLLQDVDRTGSAGDGIQIEVGGSGVTVIGSTVTRGSGTKNCWLLGSALGKVIGVDLACYRMRSTDTGFGGLTVDGSAAGGYISRLYSESPDASLYLRDDNATFAGAFGVSGLVGRAGQKCIALDGAHPSGVFSFSHNSCFGGTDATVYAYSSWNPSSATFRNNLFAGGKVLFVDAAVAAADMDLDFNHWNGASWQWRGTTDTTFAGYKTTSGEDANSASGDPKLTEAAPTTLEGFRPRADSPLCNSGTGLIAGVTKSGRRLGPRPTLGAMECPPTRATLQ